MFASLPRTVGDGVYLIRKSVPLRFDKNLLHTYDFPVEELCAFTSGGKEKMEKGVKKIYPKCGHDEFIPSSTIPDAYNELLPKLKELCSDTVEYYALCPVYKDGDTQAILTGTSKEGEDFNSARTRELYEELMIDVDVDENVGTLDESQKRRIWKVYSGKPITATEPPKRTYKLDDKTRKICVLNYATFDEMAAIVQDVREKISAKEASRPSEEVYGDNIVGVVALPVKTVFEMIYGVPFMTVFQPTSVCV